MPLSSISNPLGSGGTAFQIIGGTGKFADGTAAAPSITFNADTDTGLYRVGANVLGVTTAGVASLSFGATAGTITAATTTDLTLAGGSSGASLVLGQGANGAVTITPAGTGIITTTRPVQIGTVNDSIGLQVEFTNSNGLSGTGYRVASFFAPTAVSVQREGIILGYDTAGSGIVAARSQTAGANLAFWTYNGSAWAERGQFSKAGNLLIGGTTDITGSGGLKVFGSTAASSSTTGAFRVGNDTAATTVSIGGGKLYTGSDATIGGNLTASGTGTHTFGTTNTVTMAAGVLTATSSIKSTSATAGIGYATGAGGAVTQITSRTTGVTLNTVSGAITLVSAAGSASWQTFTVTNSAVAATDTVIVNQKSGTDLNMIHVTAVAAGSFNITFATTGGTTTEQPVFNFALIKAVAA